MPKTSFSSKVTLSKMFTTGNDRMREVMGIRFWSFHPQGPRNRIWDVKYGKLTILNLPSECEKGNKDLLPSIFDSCLLPI